MPKLRGARLAARIDALAARLDRGPVRDRGIKDALARLGAAVDACGVEKAAAEAQLTRLEAALSHLTIGIVLKDEHGEIVFRNDRANEYATARHGEALAALDLVELLGRALAGESCTRTLKLWGPPHDRWLVLSAFPLSDGQRPLGALGTTEDVSEKRRLNEMRRDFVANISHELKTPAGALIVLSDALAGGTDVEDFRRLTASMQREATRLAQIIDDLLDLSRIEANATQPGGSVPVHLVVADAVERVQPKADHRSIKIEVPNVDPALVVLGDRRQLVSAVDHLLENAVKYSDAGSSVRVTAGTGDAERGEVTIIVEDHGIGIPTRDLERIFERFYRVDKARARDTGGTGLGLSIVRHIAWNHAGAVNVDSCEGEGSTFALTLPLERAGSPVPPEAGLGPAPAAP